MDPQDPDHPRDPIEEMPGTAERHVPEKWIGQVVGLVSVRADGSRSECTLEEVNDRGVVVSREGKTSFHPWNSVVALQLGTPEARGGQVLSF